MKDVQKVRGEIYRYIDTNPILIDLTRNYPSAAESRVKIGSHVQL